LNENSNENSKESPEALLEAAHYGNIKNVRVLLEAGVSTEFGTRTAALHFSVL
jgi:hypothetical protein